MAKDIVVFCLDVTPSMNLDPLHGGDTPLGMSLQIARQLVQKRMFAGSKDLVGMVLFGTEGTDNALASNEGGYDNISALYPPAHPTVELLEILTNQVKVAPGNTEADFVDAIVVCMDMIINAQQDVKKVGEKKIYLLTDVGSAYSDDQMESICDSMREKDIELVVIGPSLDDGSGRGGAGSDDDGGDDRPGPSQRRPAHHRKRTRQQAAGEAMIGRILKAVEGTCYSFSEALQTSTFIRKNPKRQTSRFTGQLVLGKVKIPCKVFTKVMVEKPDTWKKMSAVSQASACDGNMAVKLQRSYHRNDEDETEVDKEDNAKGYRYGKSLVPISEEDEGAMKFESSRCLSLMGFTQHSNVKQHQLVGNSVQVVVASDENGARALSALVNALYETETVGVARYVWRNNSQPKLVALLPKIKAEHKYLVMVQLPFMEDIRQFVFGSLPGEKPAAQPSDEQLEAVDNLISSMDLMEADTDADGYPCKALQPKKICNPIIQRTFQCIAHRALNPSATSLPEVDGAIQSVLQPDPRILGNCTSQLDRIKDLFPLEVVEKKAKKEGAAAQVWKDAPELDLDGPPDAKRPREDGENGDEGVDFTMASLARGTVIKVGTTDPVGDFKSLVERGKFTEASRQLKGVALDLVKESFGDSLYNKALDCVKALREEAIKQGDAEVFNQFLHHVKKDLQGTRYSAFWEDQVVGGGVTLISSSEVPGCSVSSDEAGKFIKANGDDNEMAVTSAIKDGDTEDPDDLLDLM